MHLCQQQSSSFVQQAPYTPLLPLMHQLLQEQGLNSSRQPFAQIPSEESNMNILQAAGFENIKVPNLLSNTVLNSRSRCYYCH